MPRAPPDRYGRTVARVECRGKDANADQVRSGMAWAYTQYQSDPRYPGSSEPRAWHERAYGLQTAALPSRSHRGTGARQRERSSSDEREADSGDSAPRSLFACLSELLGRLFAASPLAEHSRAHFGGLFFVDPKRSAQRRPVPARRRQGWMPGGARRPAARRAAR